MGFLDLLSEPTVLHHAKLTEPVRGGNAHDFGPQLSHSPEARLQVRHQSRAQHSLKSEINPAAYLGQSGSKRMLGKRPLTTVSPTAASNDGLPLPLILRPWRPCQITHWVVKFLEP